MKRTAIVIAVILLFTGCFDSRKDQPVRDTVIKYNSLLAEGYRNMNMNSLVQITTYENAQKAYFHMAALGEARVKMDAQLLDIKFIDIKDSGKDKREVTTEEKWIYKYTGLDSNKTTDNSSGRYRIKYNLEKRSGNWLITDISVIKAEEDNKNQEIFDRPAEKGKSKN